MGKKKKKLAFLNIPDMTGPELQKFITIVDKVIKDKGLNLPYEVVIVAGKPWKTITRKELIKLLEGLKRNENRFTI